MTARRGKIDVETLVMIVIGLIAIALVIQVLDWFLGLLAGFASALIPILLAIVLILLILYLLDQI